MVETAKITSKGQVAIPSRIRKAMNAARGDMLRWQVREDEEAYGDL